MNKKEQAANKKIIRELVIEMIPTIIKHIFPIFAHLKNTQDIGRVPKNKPPTKKRNSIKRLQTKKVGFCTVYVEMSINLKHSTTTHPQSNQF